MRHTKTLRARLLQQVSRVLIFFAFLGAQGLSAQTIWEEGDIEKGQALFKGKCASCHKVTNEPLTGPGLLGIADRWGSTDEMLVKWIQNPQAAAKTGDPYIAGVVETWLPRSGWMSAQDVSEEDVRNIMAYVQNPPDAPAGAADSGCVNVDFLPEEETGDSSVWFVILLVLFLLIAMSASGVNRSLMNGLRKEEGDDPLEDISYLARLRNWAWKNRVFVSILGVFAVAFGVVKGYQALMGIGVYEGYQPEQPIKFIHSIHVCENEVDCRYCHQGAYESKHAGIPSANVCMNCHKAVQGYEWAYGEVEGFDKVDYNGEIQKIYDAIGFDPSTASYMDGEGNSGYPTPQESFEGDPIAWVKVHNLPDHVFFSHQQHVAVGGIQCQNCHGDVATFSEGRIVPVEDINELAKAQPDLNLIELSKPTLTMGWCIECHNQAKVDLMSNEYYVEMHDRMMDDERGNEELRRILGQDVTEEQLEINILENKISVKNLGGWECSKCHY